MSSEEVESIAVEATQNDIDPETTIFVGNISTECTEEDLKEVFDKEFGSVEIEIPSSKSSSGRTFFNKYAFVKFPQKIDVEAIKAKYDKQVIKDKGIYIRKALTLAERDAERQARAAARRGRGGLTRGRGSLRGGRGSFRGRGAARGGARGGARTSTRGPAVPAPAKKERVPLSEMERSNDTLYVNNVPYYATKEDLAEYFGTEADLVVLPMRRMKDVKTRRVFFSKKSNRGIAFVSFKDLKEDIQKKVEEFQSKQFQNRELTVDVAALRPPLEEDDQEEEHPEAAAEVEQQEQSVQETTEEQPTPVA